MATIISDPHTPCLFCLWILISASREMSMTLHSLWTYIGRASTLQARPWDSGLWNLLNTNNSPCDAKRCPYDIQHLHAQ